MQVPACEAPFGTVASNPIASGDSKVAAGLAAARLRPNWGVCRRLGSVVQRQAEHRCAVCQGCPRLSDGVKCARSGSGTNTDVLSYNCTNGKLVTAPDSSKPTWTVQEGTIQNAAPVLSSIPIAVKEAYR
jgi:hypothetical protein